MAAASHQCIPAVSSRDAYREGIDKSNEFKQRRFSKVWTQILHDPIGLWKSEMKFKGRPEAFY